jgi:hypothetical protein
MDWNKYKPLLAKANEKLIALTLRTQLATQPPDVEKVVECLQDGSIDPGDFQQVTQGLMKIILAMPEYQAVVKFTRESRGEYSAMYRELAAASDDDYSKFIELNQQIAIEMVTEALFGLLVQSEMLVDNRPRAAAPN